MRRQRDKHVIEHTFGCLAAAAREELVDVCNRHIKQLPYEVREKLMLVNWIENEPYCDPPKGNK